MLHAASAALRTENFGVDCGRKLTIRRRENRIRPHSARMGVVRREGGATGNRRIRRRPIAICAIGLVLLAACEGGSNLPSGSISVSLPPLPSRTPIASRTPTPPTGPAASEAPNSSSAPATSTSAPVWPWILLALVLIAGVAGYMLRRRSKHGAAAEVRRRALDAYTDAMALHDQAAVLPMTAAGDRPRALGDVSASLDRVTGEFDALAEEPAMREATAAIGDVRLSLESLRGALRAQVEARGVDPALLRDRLVDLEAALQRYRQRLSSMKQ